VQAAASARAQVGLVQAVVAEWGAGLDPVAEVQAEASAQAQVGLVQAVVEEWGAGRVLAPKV
jgi:hypothetical protein